MKTKLQLFVLGLAVVGATVVHSEAQADAKCKFVIQPPVKEGPYRDLPKVYPVLPQGASVKPSGCGKLYPPTDLK